MPSSQDIDASNAAADIAPPGFSLNPAKFMSDDANAQRNAARVTFSGVFSDGMCFAHVYLWLAKHKHFLLIQKNLWRIQDNLKKYNASVFHPAMAKIVAILMLVHWRKMYKEVKFAAAFERAWGHSNFTRAFMNSLGFGGLPSDNNGLEGKNGAIKRDLL